MYDFYRRVILKLILDLKVPFKFVGDQRQDDTPAHKALREALVNTLVHADYTGRTSVLVMKCPDMFGFRNPGLMRIPIERAKSGGQSDCRNRLLLGMFRHIGLGESAGLGLPKILSGWKSQHWRQPVLKTLREPSDQTQLELHTVSHLPEATLVALSAELGGSTFDALTKDECLVLAAAHIETTIDHSRMMPILNIHPRDLSSLFKGLVDRKLLVQDGSGRGTIYCLPSARIADLLGGLTRMLAGDWKLTPSSGELAPASENLNVSSPKTKHLYEIGKSVANRGRAPKSEVEDAILKLCAQQELNLKDLTALLNRSPETLRKYYLKPLLKEKKLRLKYPTTPNHSRQAYITEQINNE